MVGITGHQNLPNESIDFIEKELTNALRHFNGAFVGISSLAVGADQLFTEIVLRLGGSLHVIIPCQGIETTFPDNQALQSFRHLLDQADFIETLPYDHPSEDAYLAAGHRVVELSDIMIAVWDGREAKGKGGTGDIVQYAGEHGRELVIIWPPGVTR